MIHNDYLRELTLAEAQAAGAASEFSGTEKARYQQFLQHFPTARFFHETPLWLDSLEEEHGVKLPGWYRTHRCTLAGCFAGKALRQFGHKSLQDHWYYDQTNGYNSDTRRLLLENSARLQLFPIGHDDENPAYQLAINLRGHETKIYHFHEMDLYGVRAAGDDIFSMVFPLYNSPGALLASITQMREYRWEETPAGTHQKMVQTIQAQS